MRVVFVHGACVTDGTWWWHRTAAELNKRGIASVAAALPSCGETGLTPGQAGPGLSEDVAALRALLGGEPNSPQGNGNPVETGGLAEKDSPAQGGEPTIVVAHSYGGIVAAETGLPGVEHLLLVSSYRPEPGESLSTFGAPEPPPFLDFDPAGGTFGAVPELFAETFAQDCPPDVIAGGLERAARQSISVLQQPVTTAARHEVPTTYLVCAQDRGTPPAAQREFARRADKVVEFEAGHHPFLSQPEAMAELIVTLS